MTSNSSDPLQKKQIVFAVAGLVLYLSFDEGEGDTAKDRSGKGNDGQLQGNVQWVEGQHGKAYISAMTRRKTWW